MNHGRSLNRWLPALFGLMVLLAAGCGSDGVDGAQGDPGPTGPTGPAGSPGPSGPPGLDPWADLPGVVLEITDVAGATGADGTFQVGDTVSVTFTIRTRSGAKLAISELNASEIYVSGPTTNYQPILARKGDVLTRAVLNADGSYTYAFADPVPPAYLAPLNDSPNFVFDPGARASEQTGRPLVPGTYTVGLAMYKNYSISGVNYRDAGNAVADFLFGGATVLSPRRVVAGENCAVCHNELRLHGGIRRDVKLCVLCHTAGAEDRGSTNPEKATNDVTIDFRVLIHRLHRGGELRRVLATEEGLDPYRYEVIGFGESVHDFSNIAFPRMPGGTGFNQQTRNCDACHGNALEGDAWYQRPSRQACGACHDDVDFTDGTRLDQSHPLVEDGMLDEAELTDPAFRQLFHAPQADDSSCIGCHGDTVPGLGVRNAHLPPLKSPDVPGTPGIIGIQVEILNVAGGTGPSATFQPGDSPQLMFQIKDGLGTPVRAEDVASINVVMSGPTTNYQKIIPAGNSTTVNVLSSVSGFGPFMVTFGTIPATYPAQVNENKRVNNPARYPGYTGGDPFTFDGGWGELKGRALRTGTYTIGIYTSRQFTRDGVTYRETTVAATRDVLVTAPGDVATTLEPHDQIVTDTTCNACHGDLRLHGSSRRSVRLCVLCHASGAEDRARASAATPEAPEPDTIDFRVMIHKIHNARELHVVQSGGVYDIAGFNSIPEDFSHGELPAMPGGARNCNKCHATSAWMAPTERDDYRVWKKVCTSCHDSDATKAHVILMTAGSVTTGDPATNALESCSVCHGPGRDFAVDVVHKVR